MTNNRIDISDLIDDKLAVGTFLDGTLVNGMQFTAHPDGGVRIYASNGMACCILEMSKYKFEEFYQALEHFHSHVEYLKRGGENE